MTTRVVLLCAVNNTLEVYLDGEPGQKRSFPTVKKNRLARKTVEQWFKRSTPSPEIKLICEFVHDERVSGIAYLLSGHWGDAHKWTNTRDAHSILSPIEANVLTTAIAYINMAE